MARVPARRRLPAAVALVCLLLSGCAQAVEARSGASAAVPAPTAPLGRATARSTASAQPGPAEPVDRLRAALLGPDDLGPGWTAGVPPLPDPATPTPCGGAGPVARFPDALRVGSSVEGPATGHLVQEGLAVYGDAATAEAAFRASVAGLGCRQGTLNGLSVVITPVEDLRADVGGDRASGWQVGSDAVDAVLVLVQAREAVLTFAFVAPAGTAATDRVDALGLSRLAVRRALAA